MAEEKTTERGQIRHAIDAHIEAAWALSNHLREHPEISNEEFASSKRMVEELEQAGFEVTYPYAGYPTAFHALYDNGDGPEIALLTEYDALPEIGHGCGHNLHGSLSVLCGKVLKDLGESYRGKLHVIGTPAEEENGAKIGMSAQGLFDHMSLAIMMHSWSGGRSRSDMDALSLRCISVEFFGKSAHAVAAPWEGRSALAAARKFLDLIDARRECFTPDIHVNGIIVDGGNAPNIIPDYAKLRMEFRTGTMKSLGRTAELVQKCAEGAAHALDCSVKFDTIFEFADMVRNPVLETAVEELFLENGMPVAPVEEASGSSDVGNVSYHCPSIQPLLCITDASYALHTTEFRDCTGAPQAKEALYKGAEVMTALALRVFNDEAFRKEIFKAQEKELAKRL